MAIQNANQLLARFRSLGATRIFCKHLSENDNSKQQIYLGKKFEVLSFFPHGEITPCPDLKIPNFKASLNFFWVTKDEAVSALGTQLILYPQYPEVRLSGFLNGCGIAPSNHLHHRPKEQRRGIDGRVLIFGTSPDRKVFAHLAPEGSDLAEELLEKFRTFPPEGLFLELTEPVDSTENRLLVIEALQNIHHRNPHISCRRDRGGNIIPYMASNGGGYTLEARLGITPNSNSEPDYLGWEIKAYSRNRITLMTPEPNGGWYGENGSKAFVERYGRALENNVKYFTGVHRIGIPCEATGMTLHVIGFDPITRTLTDVNGSILLVDQTGTPAASWSFAGLLTHWNRKHAFAAYVPYTRLNEPVSYDYGSPILMGEHTDFTRYLYAVSSGAVVFDPASKVTQAGTPQSRIKARSQFRITIQNLNYLYETLTAENL